jgi:predicted dehydrogenase
MTPHRIAIVGAGRMGAEHAAAWRRAGLGDAIAYVVSPRTRPVLADAVGPTWVRSLSDALADPAVDLVSICTPTPSHARLAIEALDAGRNVLLEKPIALTLDEAFAVAEAARRSRGILMVAHVVRFMAGYAELVDRVSRGAVGTPRLVRAERVSAAPPSPSWFDDESRSGGLLVDFAIHDFDQANLLLGTPVAVRAVRVPGEGFGTPVVSTVEYAKGGAAQILSAADLPRGFAFRTGLEVIGSDGVDELRAVDDDPFLAQARYFLECVERGVEPLRAPVDAAVDALRVALAARASLGTGAAVAIGDRRAARHPVGQ